MWRWVGIYLYDPAEAKNKSLKQPKLYSINCDNARPVIDYCPALFVYRRMRSYLKSNYFSSEVTLILKPTPSFYKFLFSTSSNTFRYTFILWKSRIMFRDRYNSGSNTNYLTVPSILVILLLFLYFQDLNH